MNASRMCILELLDYCEGADKRLEQVRKNYQQDVDRRINDAEELDKENSRLLKRAEQLEDENRRLQEYVEEWKRHAATMQGILTATAQADKPPEPDHIVTAFQKDNCTSAKPTDRPEGQENKPDEEGDYPF